MYVHYEYAAQPAAHIVLLSPEFDANADLDIAVSETAIGNHDKEMEGADEEKVLDS
jgi:hypothetical protein